MSAVTLVKPQARAEKALLLPVLKVDDNSFYVMSEEGKIAYLVSTAEKPTCTCADFSKNKSDPNFMCKHIHAVLNTDPEAIVQSRFLEKHKARLDDRFMINLKGKDFVTYAGLLDLAHQMGLARLEVEEIQFPTKENNHEAIVKATAETISGRLFVDIGDANHSNTNKLIAQHVIRMASTRAKARVLRDLTNIGMTAIEELGDLDEIAGSNGNLQQARSAQPGAKRSKPAPQQARPPQVKPSGVPTASNQGKQVEQVQPINAETTPQAVETQAAQPQANNNVVPLPTQPPVQQQTVKMSEAQKRAVANLGRRRGMSEDEIDNLCLETFGMSLDAITQTDAASFIRQLQQAA
jgi:hypothetical protein